MINNYNKEVQPQLVLIARSESARKTANISTQGLTHPRAKDDEEDSGLEGQQLDQHTLVVRHGRSAAGGNEVNKVDQRDLEEIEEGVEGWRPRDLVRSVRAGDNLDH